MRTQLRYGIIALLLAVPILALAQTANRISPIDAPNNAPVGGPVCPEGSTQLLFQAPNQSNGIFSDDDCDACAGGAQSIADDFVLGADTEVSQITIWGGYFPGNLVPGSPGDFTVVFHSDGELPGAAFDTQTVTATSAATTGVVLFGVSEVEIVLDIAPVALTAGAYWVEIFTSTVGSTDTFFWEIGNLDGTNGRLNNAFALEVPGVSWITGNPVADNAILMCGSGEGGAPDQARFAVSKDFDDNNEAEVEVTLSCNTGLPLSQPTTISEGDPVNFVIGDFEQGALNCTVTEVTVDGYAASYDDGDGISADDCSWENLTGGQYTCVITNALQQSEVEVTKEWVDENPQFDAINYAEANWSCSNVASDGFPGSGGGLEFYGNPGIDSFFVYPDWENGTTCSVTEVAVPDGGIEIDDSDCQGIVLFPGDDASCTIVNTRLYEGIPTLSQYGLAVLALLMLGMGFVGFRRFV